MFYAPACIQEDPKSRPRYPLMSLWVDHKTGLILGAEMAEHSDYKQAFVDQPIKIVEKTKVRPRPEPRLAGKANKPPTARKACESDERGAKIQIRHPLHVHSSEDA